MSPVNIHIFDCYYLWASIRLFLRVAPMCSYVACPLLLKKQRCLTSILRELRYKLVIGMSKFEICIGGCTKIFHTEWVIDSIRRRLSYDFELNMMMILTLIQEKNKWFWIVQHVFLVKSTKYNKIHFKYKLLFHQQKFSAFFILKSWKWFDLNTYDILYNESFAFLRDWSETI